MLGDWPFEEENTYIHGAVVIYFSEEKGDTLVLNCCNFIGLSVDGPWKERAVESMVFTQEGDFLEKSLQKFNSLYGEEGDNKTWHQMIIKLMGGNEIKIVCEKIAGERLPSE